MTGPGWRWTLRTPVGSLAVLSALVLGLLAIFGPPLLNERAAELDVDAAREGMSGDHWLGTDGLGRDVLLRMLVATRLSLGLAIGATLIGTVVGIVVGSLPVVMGRRIGRLITALINFAVAMPGLLLALFLAVILGVGAKGAMIAIGLAFAPDFARLTHNLTTSVAGLDYVAAAQTLGVGRARLLGRHVLPNVAEPLVISSTIAIGGALVTFSGLSFLGLGVQSPQYDWGWMLDEGLDRIYINPAASLAPGVAIVLAGLSFNLMGDAMAHALGHRDSRSLRRIATAPVVTAAPASPADGARVGSRELVLRVDNLRVLLPDGLDGAALVDGVTFDVYSGEKIGIVGETGSGKSLTVLSIAQLVQHPLRVEAESLDFLGFDLRRTPSRAQRHMLGTSLGIVFQDPSSALNPTMRVGTQLAEVARAHLDVDRTKASSMAVERLRSVRVAAPAHRARQYPHELSGGMQQRAMLAMALMGSPALLIADEPTTGLDVTTQAQILNLLTRIRGETNAAILLVSHDIAVISEFCDRVLVMYSGTVVEDLPVAKLVTGPAHPYTEALRRAVPEVMAGRSEPLATIPGRPPDPRRRPAGCAFSPRCGYATDRCVEERPPLVEADEEHRVACWHPRSIPVTVPSAAVGGKA